MSEGPTTRRAVVLVGNPAAPYSRALRIARALHAEGFRVEIAAVAGQGLPEREMDGPIEIRRYRPSGPFARMAPTYTEAGGAIASAPTRRGVAGKVVLGLAALRRWLLWPHTVRGWWATLRTALEPADLYHACGSLTIAPALAARSRDRRAGRHSVVVYDAIDDIAGSNNVLDMPAPIHWSVAAREARWARQSDGRITVNDALAAGLAKRWKVAEPPLVVPNWPEATADPGPAVPGRAGLSVDLIRQRLGLPSTTRIVEFQGRLGPNLGLDESAEAILLVPDAVLVLIGFGRWMERCRARDTESRFAGKHFTLPAVHPDELLGWTASADVTLVPLPPVSANQRAATPNKFWESLAAGTPVVVGPGLEVMDRLVTDHRLGIVAKSLEPADLAAAISAVLDRSSEERAADRERIRKLAAERFSWPVAAAAYRTLVRDLAAP